RIVTALPKIGIALITGNITGAVLAFAGAVTGAWRTIAEIDPDNLLTETEKVLFEQWQDDVFVPFLKRVETLLTIDNNNQRNIALKMMYAYAFALKQQASNAVSNFSGLSVQALKLRHVYVVNVMDDVIKALSIAPSV